MQALCIMIIMSYKLNSLLLNWYSASTLAKAALLPICWRSILSRLPSIVHIITARWERESLKLRIGHCVIAEVFKSYLHTKVAKKESQCLCEITFTMWLYADRYHHHQHVRCVPCEINADTSFGHSRIPNNVLLCIHHIFICAHTIHHTPEVVNKNAISFRMLIERHFLNEFNNTEAYVFFFFCSLLPCSHLLSVLVAMDLYFIKTLLQGLKCNIGANVRHNEWMSAGKEDRYREMRTRNTIEWNEKQMDYRLDGEQRWLGNRDCSIGGFINGNTSDDAKDESSELNNLLHVKWTMTNACILVYSVRSMYKCIPAGNDE